MRNDAFTLMELLLTVVIIAILVSISIPSYINTVEKARAREAKATLSAMIAAEQMYAAERRDYILLSSSNAGTGGGEDQAWEAIGLDNPNIIANRAFNYNTTVGTGTCTATAIRNDGPYVLDYMTMDQNGTIDESNWMN